MGRAGREFGQRPEMSEYDSWLPYVKDNVPRVVFLGTPLVAFVAYLAYDPAQALSALFFLALIVAGNLALYRMELWTAACDATAVAAGVATRGWGVEITPLSGIRDRLR